MNLFTAHIVSVDKVYKTYNKPDELMRRLDAKDKKKRDAAVIKFEKDCGTAKISFSVHRDKSIALQELKHESIFADLIIISKQETFTRYAEKAPTRFIRDLLGDVQCPVMVVPEDYKPADKIVLLYDGAPSSVFAAKMLSYTFGNINDIPVEIFTVNEPLTGSHIPDNKLMKEFIKRHFPNATYTVVKGNAEKEIINYLSKFKENILVVTGAYRRSEVSRWFKTSMADILMKSLNVPLFIAHSC